MLGFFSAVLTPIAVFFISVVSIVALILWAISDPQGAVNLFICKIIDLVGAVLPSTPENLKISTFINSAASALPAVGVGVISEIFSTITSIFAISMVVKIYKLIPFKAT